MSKRFFVRFFVFVIRIGRIFRPMTRYVHRVFSLAQRLDQRSHPQWRQADCERERQRLHAMLQKAVFRPYRGLHYTLPRIAKMKPAEYGSVRLEISPLLQALKSRQTKTQDQK